MNNVIQTGLFNKWTKVHYSFELRNFNLSHTQSDQFSENILTLNHTSTAFYIILSCLSFSITTFFIEIFYVIIKLRFARC